MNAFIIAAGMGKRLRPFTADLPKGLLPIGRDTIIGKQLKIFNNLKIKNINVIVGYKKEKFSFKNVNYIFNRNYKKNNILNSLFVAQKEFNDECIISYSDIIFKKKIVKKLINKFKKNDIVVVLDKDWKKNYIKRIHHPISEAEKAFYDKNLNLKKIGKNILLKKTNSEFIGMMRLSKKGCEVFKQMFYEAKNKYKGKNFFSAVNFQKAYITDFFKYLIKKNIQIKCLVIKNNWMEIDTTEDLVKAQTFYENKK
tara:strand:- start:1327 stop:2088 length:762 start_codon:yes stop_codon:yes gene_type:complete